MPDPRKRDVPQTQDDPASGFEKRITGDIVAVKPQDDEPRKED